jgi:hypothetical protein
MGNKGTKEAKDISKLGYDTARSVVERRSALQKESVNARNPMSINFKIKPEDISNIKDINHFNIATHAQNVRTIEIVYVV